MEASYVTELVRNTREGGTEGRWRDLRELDGNLEGTGCFSACPEVRYGNGETYNAPCALDAELDAERAGCESAEGSRQDPEWDERCAIV